jgi:hypothetical protein
MQLGLRTVRSTSYCEIVQVFISLIQVYSSTCLPYFEYLSPDFTCSPFRVVPELDKALTRMNLNIWL